MHSEAQTKLLSLLRHEEVESLFNFLGDIQFWIKEAAGGYLRVNRAFQLNYSLSSIEEAIGKTDFDLSPPWLAEAFRADDELALEGKQIVNRIELVGRFDMAERWFCTSKVPVHDAAGHIVATAGVSQPLPELQAPDFPVPELAAALAGLQQAPEKSWTNEALARLVGMSVSSFERRFRQHLQTSPMQFLKRLRLAHAAASLIQSSHSISEIAIENGFSDQAHLSREFKRLFGATPSGWRASHSSRD